MEHTFSAADREFLERIHDLLRKSRLNALYYESRLLLVGRLNTTFEITMAIGTSGAVAAWAIWKGDVGDTVWPIVAGTATLLAVIKPILALGREIELFSKQRQGYHANFYALDKLVFQIQQDREIKAEHRKRFDSVYDRHAQLSLEDEKSPKLWLIEGMRGRVNKEMPPDRLWMPPANPDQGPLEPDKPRQTVKVVDIGR